MNVKDFIESLKSNYQQSLWPSEQGQKDLTRILIGKRYSSIQLERIKDKCLVECDFFPKISEIIKCAGELGISESRQTIEERECHWVTFKLNGYWKAMRVLDPTNPPQAPLYALDVHLVISRPYNDDKEENDCISWEEGGKEIFERECGSDKARKLVMAALSKTPVVEKETRNALVLLPDAAQERADYDDSGLEVEFVDVQDDTGMYDEL